MSILPPLEEDAAALERAKRRETRTFIFLTVVMAPMLAVAIVGLYGLTIWVSQVFTGPPGG